MPKSKPELSHDDTAILPVRIGTGIAVVLTVWAAFTQPISPNALDGVWWFGAGLIASISGVLGLVFLHWRQKRLTQYL